MMAVFAPNIQNLEWLVNGTSANIKVSFNIRLDEGKFGDLSKFVRNVSKHFCDLHTVPGRRLPWGQEMPQCPGLKLLDPFSLQFLKFPYKFIITFHF